MSTTTVRASEHSHKVLQQLSQREGISMTDALDKVTNLWEETQYFEDLNESFAALRSDPAAWAQEQEERRTWDATLSDNVSNERRQTETG